MDDNELLHESFDYHDFFGENTDDYHTMTCAETINVSTINNTNENLGHLNTNNGTPIKNRPTGYLIEIFYFKQKKILSFRECFNGYNN
jgi:hypothetical protein